jgi:hypothetical protein
MENLMINGLISAEFILLCNVILICSTFSTVIFIRSFKHYLRTDPGEQMLRKSIKYFTLIFVTIDVAGVFSLISNIYFLATLDGVVAGYIYAVVTSIIMLNVFCAWQFITYLLHPDRRPTKYLVGIYCIIGMVLIWFFTPTVTSVLHTPNLKHSFLYLYLWIGFAFVWSILFYEFFKSSRAATERRDKYRFFCIGLSGVFAFLMFPVGVLSTLLSWLIILTSTVLLYLGYYFPNFFQQILKLQTSD